MKVKDLSKYIDHTLLKADASILEIKTLCEEAMMYNFTSVCVPPYFVHSAKNYLESSSVKVCTVIGFPLGYHDVAVKIEEINKSIELGADELDAVINIAAVKSNDWDTVKTDIDRMATKVGIKNKVLKLIFETSYLSFDEIGMLCELCNDFDVHFAKTSTGFSSAGAKPEVVEFMRASLNKKVKIKASGGIKTLEQLQLFIACGADRIGTSSGVNIISEL